MKYSYEITDLAPEPAGWLLRLLEDGEELAAVCSPSWMTPKPA